MLSNAHTCKLPHLMNNGKKFVNIKRAFTVLLAMQFITAAAAFVR
jgi:hypothetical protein